jgi:hypothetical protein
MRKMSKKPPIQWPVSKATEEEKKMGLHASMCQIQLITLLKVRSQMSKMTSHTLERT